MAKSTAKDETQTRPATVEAERVPQTYPKPRVTKEYPKIGDIKCPACGRQRSNYLGPVTREEKKKIVAKGEKRRCRACGHKWIRPTEGTFPS